MFNRNNLPIVVIAIFSAIAGLLASHWINLANQSISPPDLQVLQAGDQRVDLILPDTRGEQRRLSEWDGKLLLINFWATWCAPCREEMPLFDRVRQQYSGSGLEVIGIALDDSDSVREFLRAAPVQYPILLGDSTGQNPSILFGDTRSVLPYSVLINRDGRLLAQHAGSFTEATLTTWLQPHIYTSSLSRF